MIDSAEFARLSALTFDRTLSDGRNQLKLARAIYTVGAKRMQERAAEVCLTTSDSAVSSSCAEAIRILEIQ